MTSEEMACQELVEVVTEYLEGALPPDDRQRFETHLTECPFCIEYVEQLREIARSLHPLGGDTVPPDRRDALLDAFRGQR